jgi:xanthine/uracil permease
MSDTRAMPAWSLHSAPPWSLVLVSAFQHAGIQSVGLFFPLLVVQAAGLDTYTQARYLDLAMLALGIACLLQVWGRRGIGSGLLIPSVYTAAYLPPAIALAQIGGLGAVATMTIVAGLAEIVLALVIRRLRAFIPAEIMGLVVLLIGVVLGLLAFRMMFGAGMAAMSDPARPAEMAVALVTLAVIVAVTIWGGKRIRPIGVLIGLLVGSAISVALDAADGRLDSLPDLDLRFISWPLAVPTFEHWAVLPGFLVGAMACLARASGDIVTAQRANDPGWCRADFDQVRSGVVADGIGTVVAGVLGVTGINTYSASVGLSVATGILARRVGIAVGLLWCVLAFIPGTASLLLAIPRGVLGASLLFSAAFIVMAGMSIITQRLLDGRRVLTVGIALVLGLSHDVMPGLYAALPGWLGSILGSSLVEALLVALLLNAFFRIGATQLVTQRWTADGPADALTVFITEAGRRWGAVAEVIQRAANALEEFGAAAPELLAPGTSGEIEARWDDHVLTIRLRWTGERLPPPGHGSETLALAATLLRHRARDGMAAAQLADGREELRLRFDS